MSKFIHLHNHTHYSLLDGASTVSGLVKASVEQEMSAVALTDHGVMFGALEFYKKAKKAGIRPIIGCEAYVVTKGTRFEKPPSSERESKKRGGEIYHHLLLLVKNEAGYRNLMKLCTLSHTEGYYYKPRLDLELLSKYHEGIVCTSACPVGIIGSHLVNDEYQQAQSVAGTYKEIFGDDFYIEIQNH
jgi:DNA polymerase-3 subunit alpha